MAFDPVRMLEKAVELGVVEPDVEGRIRAHILAARRRGDAVDLGALLVERNGVSKADVERIRRALLDEPTMGAGEVEFALTELSLGPGPQLAGTLGVDAPDAPAPPRSATVECRYTPMGLLGRGGMGVVFEATDRDLSRVVAVKTLIVREPGTVARFLQEARLTARLEHPSIVPVYDLGADARSGAPYLVMKKVRGRTRKERTR
jgi:hypothetical protein